MRDFMNRSLMAIAMLLLAVTAAQATNYYTLASGDWSNPAIWTQDTTGLTSVGAAVPGASDRAFVINNKTVTNTVSPRTVISTYIQGNATLDLGAIIGNNLGTVSGSGILKINSTSFPSGTFTAFVTSTGGTIEFYNINGILPANLVYNNLIVSNSSGSANDCSFANGNSPTNYTINGNLSIVNSGAGSLTVNLGNAVTNVINMDVVKNISITAGATFKAGNFNAIHNLSLNGTLSNAGTIQFSNSAQFVAATNGAVNLTFNGSVSSILSCDNTTNLYTLKVNKGFDQATLLTVNSSAGSNLKLFSDNDALLLLNGTLRLNTNNNLTRFNAGGLFTISNSSRLWIDGANVLLNGSANGVEINGEFKITSGSFSVGNEGFILGLTGLISIDGGTSTIEKLRPIVTVGTQLGSFNMTAGVLNVDGSTSGSGSADFPRFCLPYPGQGFYHSGGILNIANPETGTANDGGILLGSDANNYSVAGGIINVMIPASSANFNINSTIPLYSLYVSKAGGGSGKLVLAAQPIGAGIALSSPIAAKPLQLNQDLVLVTGNNPVFQTNGNDLSVKRNFSINIGTTYTPGNNTTKFNGLTTQYFTLNGTITSGIYNLTIDKPLTVTCFLAGAASTIEILNDLNVLVGTFNEVNRKINVYGNVYNSGLVNGLRGVFMLSTTNQVIAGNGAGRIERLIIDKPSGLIALTASMQIERELRLAKGVLDIDLYTLNFTTTANVYDGLTGTGTTFDNTKMIRTGGISSAGGIRKRYSLSTTSFIYPLGNDTKYTPALINIVGTATTYGYLTIRAVNGEHPIVTAPNQALKYYWKTSSTGFNLGSASVEHTYTYDESDVVTGSGVNESDYVPAFYQPFDVVWYAGEDYDVDETANSIFIDPGYFGQVLDGEFTAGSRSPADPFDAVIAFYSMRSGNWEDNNPATTPWSIVGHSGPATSITPGPKNPVFVGDGIAFNHSVIVTANNANSGNLFIGGGSTVDIGSTVGHNFSVLNGFGVTGSGLLRISSAIATAAFPAGDFGLFLGNTGGTVEYYTTGTDFTIPTVSALPTALVLNNYNYLNVIPESGKFIRMPNIDLNIFNILKMSGAGELYLNTATSRTLTTGGSMNFQAGTTIQENTTAQQLMVSGNFNVSAGAAFKVANSGGTVIHNLIHRGAVSNLGEINFNPGGTGSVCYYTSVGTGNRSFSGANGAAVTRLSRFTINRGVDPINEYNFDVQGTFVTPTNDWLYLLNGTAKFSRGYNLTLTDQAVNFVIPISAKLQVNHTSCIVNIGVANSDLADLTLIGKLQIDAGTVNIGNSSNNTNNDIEYASIGLPEIEVKGNSSLFVNGQIRRNPSVLSGSLVYRQTGNSIVIINGANAIVNRAKLELDNFGSSFEMTGTSTLRLVRGGGTSFGDLYLHAFNTSITGGTILLQQGGIGSDQVYSIDATNAVNNITINGTINNATCRVINTPLTVKGTLLINTNLSVFNANGIDVNLNGALNNKNTNAAMGIAVGGFRAGSLTQLTTFGSTTANQSLAGIVGNITNFAHLKINNQFGGGGNVNLAVNSDVRVNGNLLLTKGILNDGGNTITCISDIENSSKHVSAGTGNILCLGTVKQFISGDGTGQFGNLVINNNSGVTTQATQTVNDGLTLTNGSLFIDAHLLRLTENAFFSGSFSGTRMIQTNGLLGDSGVVKLFSSGTETITFPVGSDVDYMPAFYNITNNTAAGSIRVSPVKSKHPATTNPLNEQLNYFWSVKSTGFADLEITHIYTYKDIFVTGNENNYVTGRYLVPQWTPNGGIAGTVDATANTMTLTNVDFIYGDYTAGDPTEFDPIDTLYSRNATLGGNWEDGTTWAVTGHGGPASGITPTTQIVKIAAGHTVTINSDARTCSVLENQGTLDIQDYGLNVFGYASGTGLMKISANSTFSFLFPSGDFNAFNSSTGGTVEYYGSQVGTLSSNPVYNNLVFSGTSIKGLNNVNLTVNGNLTINDGVVDNSIFNKNITLLKNWNNNVNSSAFLAGTGSLNLNGANQTIGGTASSNFYNFNVNGTAVKTLGRSIVVANNLAINSATLDVSTSNFAIDLAGKFTNNATFNARQGLITLNGVTAQQIIGGTTNTNFYDMTCLNLLGAKLAAPQTMLNTLNVLNGTFDCNPYYMTLKSTLTRTARIAALTNGNVTGNFVMERLAPGPKTGWAILGTPIQNAKINQWTDDFPTSGFIGSTGIAGSFISIYNYLEFDLAPFDAPTSYAPITNANTDAIAPGVGYWVYLGTGYTLTADILIDVTGSTTKGNFDFGVGYSDSGNSGDDGFNMVANPYPSAIDWDSPNWTKTNIDNAIYMWQADLGQYATYISGVSTNGASNLIPSSQGFFVKANALLPNLTASETIKAAGNPTFIRSSNSLTQGSLLRLKVEGNDFKDEAILRFNENATVNYDGQFDGIKLFSSNPDVPSISLVTANRDLSINTLPANDANIAIPVRVKVGVSGNYTLSFEGLDAFEGNACITFEDLKTGTKTDMKNIGDYQFYMDNQTVEPRFIIHIAKNPIVAISNASCSNTNDGAIEINNTGSISNWNYTLSNTAGVVIANQSIGNNNTSIDKLAAGTYQIAYNNGFACAALNAELVVPASTSIAANFTASKPVEVSNGIQVDFTAQASESAQLVWNFGDGNVVEGGKTISHVYSNSGNYTIQLNATEDICVDQLAQTITLVSNKFAAANTPQVLQSNGQYLVSFTFNDATAVTIQLVDVLGKEVGNAISKTVSNERIMLNTSMLSEGVYFVNITYDGSLKSTKIVK